MHRRNQRQSKRVLVTGGSRGLGLAICRELLSKGCHVVTCARTASIELVSLLKQFRGKLQFYDLDLGSLEGVTTLAAEARLLDGVDGFVANAADGLDGLLVLTPRESIERCLQVNLLSTISLTREVIKGMLPAGGSLVFIGSVAATTSFKGLSVYAATKGGIMALSRTLAREYGSLGIRSNCVLAGFMKTDMTKRISQERLSQIRRRTALGRIGTVEEIAHAVVFLLSDEARFITGAELTVDGGFSS